MLEAGQHKKQRKELGWSDSTQTLNVAIIQSNNQGC
jgi:hypothetical protein